MSIISLESNTGDVLNSTRYMAKVVPVGTVEVLQSSRGEASVSCAPLAGETSVGVEGGLGMITVEVAQAPGPCVDELARMRQYKVTFAGRFTVGVYSLSAAGRV